MSRWLADVVLELKTVADVALVGYPSAGKSYLIWFCRPPSRRSRTTLHDPHPNLGVVTAGETVYTIADVPGLIPGASQGKGLGLEFLRHVERCSMLVHVLDTATLESERDPVADLDIFVEEELKRCRRPRQPSAHRRPQQDRRAGRQGPRRDRPVPTWRPAATASSRCQRSRTWA